MKYEWRQQEKALYAATKQPQLLAVPEQRFMVLSGSGDPNGLEFRACVQTLYPAAYGLKAAYKTYCQTHEMVYDDYVVFPLEGVWSLTVQGQQLPYLDKNEFIYDIMIRIPDFVPTTLITPTLDTVQAKKELAMIDAIQIKTYEAQTVGQILHVGSYDTEPESFEKLDALVAEHNKQRVSKIHREIYLSDARRVAPDKLKTLLRYKIE